MPIDLPSQCVLCGRNDFRLIYPLERGSIVRCRGCRLLSYHPVPSPEELMAYYEKSYLVGSPSHTELSRAREKKVRYGHRCLEAIERYRPPGTLLDVGSGFGAFLEAATGRGWRAEGLELSSTLFRASTEEFGHRVRHATLDFAGLSDGVYDAVTLWMFLEHTPDPPGTLKTVRRILKGGGILAMTVPNAASLVHAVQGKRWEMIIPPGHLYYYSPRTLRLLLEKAGFRLLLMRTVQEDCDNEFVVIAKHLVRRSGLTRLKHDFDERIDWRLRRLFRSRPFDGMRRLTWRLFLGPEIEAYATPRD